jgi:hypothetical protein
VDTIPLSKTVMFVGDYFTLMTTIVLDEEIRNKNETDNDFAIRVASVFMKEYYDFDVALVSNNIGIVDEEGIKIEDD